MDGEKKKRKMDDEENEEEKMEKFFALIKSTREVRERLAGAAQPKEKPVADKPPPLPAAAAVWNPTFRVEDFMDAPPPAPPQEAEENAAEAGPSSKEGEKQERESDERDGDKGLDLNLSL